MPWTAKTLLRNLITYQKDHQLADSLTLKDLRERLKDIVVVEALALPEKKPPTKGKS